MKKREQGEARVDRGWHRGFDVAIILVLHSDRARGSRKKRARLEPPSRAHTNANDDYCATAEWKATLEKFTYPKEKRRARGAIRRARGTGALSGGGKDDREIFFFRTIFNVRENKHALREAWEKRREGNETWGKISRNVSHQLIVKLVKFALTIAIEFVENCRLARTLRAWTRLHSNRRNSRTLASEMRLSRGLCNAIFIYATLAARFKVIEAYGNGTRYSFHTLVSRTKKWA